MKGKMTRRDLLAASAGLATSAALLGVTAAFAQGREKLVYLGWSHTEAGSKEFFSKLFEDFEAANPSIELETIGVPFGEYEKTLLLRRRSDQRVDVAQVSDRMLATFVAAGGLADVDAIFGAENVEARYDAAALKIGILNGKRYGLPWATGTIGLVGNGKVLETAGISEKPKDFAQLVEMLREVKKAVPASSPFGISTKGPALAHFESQLIFWNHGASIIDPEGNIAVDSEEARAALSLLADMVKEGLILPGNDRFDFRQLYSQELVGFFPDQPLIRAFARDMSGQGEAYDPFIVPMPMPVADPSIAPASIIGGHLVVFPQYGRAEPTADGPAAKLVDLFMSTDVQVAYYNETGNFPTTKDAIAALQNDAYFVA